LKLKCDEPLSEFAFKFNLCRYTVAITVSQYLKPNAGDPFTRDLSSLLRVKPSFPSGAGMAPFEQTREFLFMQFYHDHDILDAWWGGAG
jgi:hypothetical protein